MVKCDKCGYENKDDAIQCEVCEEYLLEEVYFPYKSRLLAILLSFIGGLIIPLHGLGNLYLGFIRRFLIEFIVGFVTTVIVNLLIHYGYDTITPYLTIFLLLWWAFTIYDSYNCANSINYGRDIPKLFGREIK